MVDGGSEERIYYYKSEKKGEASFLNLTKDQQQQLYVQLESYGEAKRPGALPFKIELPFLPKIDEGKDTD